MLTTRRGFLAALCFAPFAALLPSPRRGPLPPILPPQRPTFPEEIAWSATDDPRSWNGGAFYLAS